MPEAELLPFGDAGVLWHLPLGVCSWKPAAPRHGAFLVQRVAGHTDTVYPAAPDSKDQPNNKQLFIGQLHISRPTDA